MAMMVIESEDAFKKMMQEILSPFQEEIARLKNTVEALKRSEPKLDREKAGRYLGITAKALKAISHEKGEKHFAENPIPCEKVGGRYYYDVEDLVNYKSRQVK